MRRRDALIELKTTAREFGLNLFSDVGEDVRHVPFSSDNELVSR